MKPGASRFLSGGAPGGRNLNPPERKPNQEDTNINVEKIR